MKATSYLLFVALTFRFRDIKLGIFIPTLDVFASFVFLPGAAVSVM